jgi:4a-hydroxytetrahydrobiopterin dehydratase
MEWTLKDGKLVNTYVFKSQTALAQFITTIAHKADEINHHPDYKVFKAFTLEISLFTHDTNAVTEIDYTLASFISELV